MKGIRWILAACSLLAFGWLALGSEARASGMTKCRCDNGQIVYTQREGEHACPDACSVHGGGGRVWTEEDDRCDYRGVEMNCADARRLREQDRRRQGVAGG